MFCIYRLSYRIFSIINHKLNFFPNPMQIYSVVSPSPQFSVIHDTTVNCGVTLPRVCDSVSSLQASTSNGLYL